MKFETPNSLAFWCAVLVVAAGCVEGDDAAASNETRAVMPGENGEPQQGPVGAITGSNESSGQPAPIEPRLNITSCKGAATRVDLPAAIVRPYVPENYTIGDGSFSVALVHLSVSSCDKVSVDGVDAGPLSMQMLTVTIRDPPGLPPASNLISRYAFELRTDNSAVNEWFLAGGWPVLNGTSKVEILPSLEYVNETKASVRDERQALYEFDSFPYSSLLSKSNVERHFFGPNPQSDYATNEIRFDVSSGGGPGKLTMSESTALSKVMAGATTTEAMAWNNHEIARVVTRAASGNQSG